MFIKIIHIRYLQCNLHPNRGTSSGSRRKPTHPTPPSKRSSLSSLAAMPHPRRAAEGSIGQFQTRATPKTTMLDDPEGGSLLQVLLSQQQYWRTHRQHQSSPPVRERLDWGYLRDPSPEFTRQLASGATRELQQILYPSDPVRRLAFNNLRGHNPALLYQLFWRTLLSNRFPVHFCSFLDDVQYCSFWFNFIPVKKFCVFKLQLRMWPINYWYVLQTPRLTPKFHHATGPGSHVRSEGRKTLHCVSPGNQIMLKLVSLER